MRCWGWAITWRKFKRNDFSKCEPAHQWGGFSNAFESGRQNNVPSYSCYIVWALFPIQFYHNLGVVTNEMQDTQPMDFIKRMAPDQYGRRACLKMTLGCSGLAANLPQLTFLSFLLSCSTFVWCQDTNFTFSTFDAGSVTLVADARLVGGSIRVANISSESINSQSNSAGRALYPHLVQIRNTTTKTVASFETSFTFSINTYVDNNGFLGRPSGIAWGFFPDDTNIGGYGEYLGLMNASNDNFLTNHIFAIEVDTGYSQFGHYVDISGCHLGIDITTLDSNPVYDMASPPGNNNSLCIENRGVHTLNVAYNGLSQVLSVELLDSGSVSKGHINATIDIYATLIDTMYVGFSASGIYFFPQTYSVFSWNFSSTFAQPALPPSAATSSPAFSPGPSSSPGPSLIPTASSPFTTNSGDTPGIAPSTGGNCTGNSTTCPSATKSNTIIIYGAAASGAGALLLLLGLGLGCLCVRRSSRGTGKFDIPGGVAVVGPRRFTYKELCSATKNFSSSELLGKGGSGSVYRGVLRDSGAMVAVKVIQDDKSREMAEKEFQAEVSIINQIRHRNLVQLQGWCNEKGMLCLVCEYLPNGSLDSLLRKEMQAPNTVLPWGTRFNILTGVAAALAYLHEEIGQCILHRDLKPGNVLLDSNYNACLADFGLARLIDHDQVAPTTMLAGTMGYMAPELPHTGRATTQTDAYSFGILVVEMICGRRPTDIDRETQMPLLDCVWTAHAGDDILCIVDAKIRDDPKQHEIERTLLLGLLCCHPDPQCRPSMRNVRQILTGDSPLPPVPSEKPTVKYSYYSQYGPYAELDIAHDDDEPSYSTKDSSFSAESKSILN